MILAKGYIGKHLLISGHVQGVGYRYNLHCQAMAIGVVGWCRNLPDGRVEAELFGLPDTVEKLLAWCYQGPNMAEVSHIEINNLEVSEASMPEAFEIRR